MYPIKTHFARQNGVGLVEVLVSLFILAVGLLGVLAMQANGMKSNQKSEFSTEAYLLAADMVDRIQAHNDIDSTADDFAYHDKDTDSVLVSASECIATGCNLAQQVDFDVAEWRRELLNRLPNGRGTINAVPASADAPLQKYVVTVMWDAELTGATGECDDNDDARTCYTVEFKL